MQTDLQKWNPFRFLRKAGEKAGANEQGKKPSAVASRSDFPDVPWQFSADPWRMMHEFFHDPYAGFGALDRWFGDFTPVRFQPHIDVVDDGDALRVTAELPGVEREDLHTTIENGTLVLRGEKKQDMRSEEKGCYRLERAYGAFLRTIPLPEDIDADKVDAKFDKGILTLRLPKTGASKSTARKIEIK
ncbi:Hsp20/alpha crystallin family protein [Paraburkholderia sp. LEh10]|uniref:Hsp20/alpha crystallin family protein n=1 Tax=Paraburkholderia sp. LEh10 TaxID=2821353 RepID=UPI001AE749E7|nr:Hsp20/alpha crystallin family protein [Paraburkholderia sp. LEh10]MBP0593585.1 Hsp20/alpha crystallin family protein [Paraburkholderia sp. LEh10]